MTKQISAQRKITYYLGIALILIGFCSFFSVLFTAAMHVGDFNNFEGQIRSNVFRAIGGMLLVFVGGIVASIGARGLAGSGVVLDPGQAREELEPYTRMAGGMVKDALDEANINLGGKSETVVMIKCSACGKLNEEDSKFCQECGQKF